MLNSEEKKKRPQDKRDKKAGLIWKRYKVNKQVAEEFRQAYKADEAVYRRSE